MPSELVACSRTSCNASWECIGRPIC